MHQVLQAGHHIKVNRGLYHHHGIYMGGGWVAELAKPAEGGVTRMVSLATFTRGAGLQIVDHANGLPLHAVIENVRRAPHWRRYDLLDWNCEHFATWCSTHVVESEQVRSLVQGVAISLLVALIASAAAA